MAPRDSDSNFIAHLKEYWLIYAFAAQIIITFVTSTSRITALEARTLKLETSQDQEAIVLSEIKARLASIDTSLQYLKERR